MMTPDVVIRPTQALEHGLHAAVNHKAPSGPAAIHWVGSPSPGSGTGYSVNTPSVVMRKILPYVSANQSAPSDPTVIAWGSSSPAGNPGTGYTVIAPPVVTRRI